MGHAFSLGVGSWVIISLYLPQASRDVVHPSLNLRRQVILLVMTQESGRSDRLRGRVRSPSGEGLRCVIHYFASSASRACKSAGSSGVVLGAKRAVTVPLRATTNFSKFQRISGSGFVSIP